MNKMKWKNAISVKGWIGKLSRSIWVEEMAQPLSFCVTKPEIRKLVFGCFIVVSHFNLRISFLGVFLSKQKEKPEKVETEKTYEVSNGI